jgi:NitT/TauT family transport system ATP-binding protein
VRLEFDGVGVRFRGGVEAEAVRDVDLVVDSGEFVAIVGPSGCGKSTLLNAVAGLLPPHEVSVHGRIMVDGHDVRSTSPRALNLGYVFQRDNLLPWRTVAHNVGTGLEIRGAPRQARSARVSELLEMVGLTEFAAAYPHQLSGGMRQRVALVRTLAYDPRLILMDEPFGALDAHTRLVLQAELLRIWERARMSILFVTHDLAEALTLAQRVVLFSRRPGSVRRVYQIDLPYPRDPFALRGEPRFTALESELWQHLQTDYRASLLPAAA